MAQPPVFFSAEHLALLLREFESNPNPYEFDETETTIIVRFIQGKRHGYIAFGEPSKFFRLLKKKNLPESLRSVPRCAFAKGVFQVDEDNETKLRVIIGAMCAIDVPMSIQDLNQVAKSANRRYICPPVV